MTTPVVSVLGFPVSLESPKVMVARCLDSKRSMVVNTINPHSYVVSKKDPDFRRALISSDHLLPDGSGIVLGIKLLYGISGKKVAGYDFFISALDELNQRSGRVFMLGSTESTLNKIHQRISIEYPKINLATLSPPFKDSFSRQEIKDFAAIINDFSPNVVFVGLTAPKQEKLIAEIMVLCNGITWSGIGAVFDYFCGSIKRPSILWQRMHLEWLIRLLGEPKRLWRRNLISMPVFVFDLLIAKIKNIVCKNSDCK